MTVSHAVQQDHDIQSQSYISLLRLYPPTQSSDTKIPPLEYYNVIQNLHAAITILYKVLYKNNIFAVANPQYTP